jgi:hypothetical protein
LPRAQNVYDPSNHKIGKVEDVLVSPDGKINALIIGVIGVVGVGEKDVAVNFSSIKQNMKDNETYLTMDTTKNVPKAAPGFKYDRQGATWVLDHSQNSSR